VADQNLSQNTAFGLRWKRKEKGSLFPLDFGGKGKTKRSTGGGGTLDKKKGKNKGKWTRPN